MYNISRFNENKFMKTLLDFLTPKKVTFHLNNNSTIRQALEKFDAHKFSVVPILDDNGKYKGTISEGDILRYIKNHCNFSIEIAEKVRLNEIEKYRSYFSLKIDADLTEVFALALEQNFIPIVDDSDTYIGIIKRRDIIKYFYEENIKH